MKAKEYELISFCIENGINYGYQRAFKYSDVPSEDEVKRKIYEGVMNEISEWFDFNGDKSET